MAANKRTPLKREADLVVTADLYQRGVPMTEIAKTVGVTWQQIQYDLADIRKRWLEKMIEKFDAKKAEELAKIDRLEREYWEAWDRSRQDRTSTTVKAGEGKEKRKEVSKTTEQHYGDPRFLYGIQWCISKRCEILGLNAPTKLKIIDDEHEWTDGQIRKIAERALASQRFKQAAARN